MFQLRQHCHPRTAGGAELTTRSGQQTISIDNYRPPPHHLSTSSSASSQSPIFIHTHLEAVSDASGDGSPHTLCYSREPRPSSSSTLAMLAPEICQPVTSLLSIERVGFAHFPKAASAVAPPKVTGDTPCAAPELLVIGLSNSTCHAIPTGLPRSCYAHARPSAE